VKQPAHKEHPIEAAEKMARFDFVTAVLQALNKVPASELYGGNKAWIHDVWAQFLRLPGAPPISLETFKELIVEELALRMRMVRADLIQAMKRGDVEESNTFYRIGSRIVATFNFFRR
jgi:hypothetical protein